MTARRKDVLVDGVLLGPADHLILLGLTYVRQRLAAEARKPRQASGKIDQHQIERADRLFSRVWEDHQ